MKSVDERDLFLRSIPITLIVHVDKHRKKFLSVFAKLLKKLPFVDKLRDKDQVSLEIVDTVGTG